ncbi:MAG: hypothetical protein JSC188_000900 [Candidatus Tokpelaia sp. JSC188]|nr:MAG: hypothetical protein JSC188_000900 [Candidatus Tokpelaia sp. JSC188]
MQFRKKMEILHSDILGCIVIAKDNYDLALIQVICN